MRRRRSYLFSGRLVTLAAALVASVCIAACSSSASSSGSSGAIQSGGTVTFALPADSTPNYIFPLFGPSSYLSYNIYDVQDLLWKPLYWFGQTGSVTMDSALSLAKPPVYENDDAAVKITLNKAEWSDHQPVTSRDR